MNNHCSTQWSLLTGSLSRPLTNFLVHFRARDLERLHKQGQFWHIFFCNGGVVISQNEKNIWTVHMPLPPDTNTELLDHYEVVFKVLGGSSLGHKIDIDEILVTSAWTGHICVFLSGDVGYARFGYTIVSDTNVSAHQNIPLGGYGMNTGLVINGYGGEELLNSYEIECHPLADRNVHITDVEWVHGEGQGTVISTDEKGESLRDRIRSHVLTNDGENKCLGVEMGSRNFPSPIVLQGTDDLETPEWNEKNYIPSTSRGARAPHVFLRDGDTSIHDLLGFDYSLVDFTTEGNFASSFKEAASHLGIPIATVHLPNEQHVRDLGNVALCSSVQIITLPGA
ncbi:hypothetical protein DPV78_009723 [Talaromyces pinophilus]|nr:hypothetical protein DPV78_009723 [Talaromyces pinophilus]